MKVIRPPNTHNQDCVEDNHLLSARIDPDIAEGRNVSTGPKYPTSPYFVWSWSANLLTQTRISLL